MRSEPNAGHNYEEILRIVLNLLWTYQQGRFAHAIDIFLLLVYLLSLTPAIMHTLRIKIGNVLSKLLEGLPKDPPYQGGFFLTYDVTPSDGYTSR